MKRSLWLLPLLGLAACGGSGITDGVVVNKEHRDPYVEHWIYQQPIYMRQQSCYYSSASKSNVCTSMQVQIGSIPIPEETYHPEHWGLRLRKCSDDQKGKCREGWLSVQPLTYQQVAIGDYYQKPKSS